MGGLVVWLCDKWSRSISGSRLHVPAEMEWHARNESTMLKLTHESVGKNYEPGQYFFINIPAISLNEWHPFTASAVLDEGIVFYIKKMSNPNSLRGSWTQRLAELADRQDSAPVMPLVRLSGPFGHTQFTEYKHLLLVAGGIGITPMIAIFAHLRKQQLLGLPLGALKSVQLVWMSRHVSEFRLFEHIFALIANDDRAARRRSTLAMVKQLAPIPEGEATVVQVGEANMGTAGTAGTAETAAQDFTTVTATTTPTTATATAVSKRTSLHPAASEDPEPPAAAIAAGAACTFDLNLYCTRRESWVSLTTRGSVDYVDLFVRNGRCNLREVFQSHAHAGPDTVAAVCGPPALMLDVSALAWEHGCDFHAEQFLF